MVSTPLRVPLQSIAAGAVTSGTGVTSDRITNHLVSVDLLVVLVNSYQ